MAILYWNTSTKQWQSTDPDFAVTDAINSSGWSGGGTDSYTKLAYKIYGDTDTKKITLSYKLAADFKKTGANMYICSSPYFRQSGEYLKIKSGSTVLATWTPQNVGSASTIYSYGTKFSRINLTNGERYQQSSGDGTTVVVPFTLDITNYLGTTITTEICLDAVQYINNPQSVSYFTTYEGSATLNTPSGFLYTISYKANGHGSDFTATKTYNKSYTIANYLSSQSTGGSSLSATIYGNANGGSWSGDHGSAGYVTAKTTYSQSTWNTNSSGTGDNYPKGTAYTTNANLTLYAKWSSSTTAAYGTSYTLPSGTPTKAARKQTFATVTFNANGGTTSKSSETSERNIPQEFIGWYTSGGDKRTESSRVTSSETVYAHYGDGTPETQSDVTTPTEAQCTRTGYKLLGWNTDASATTITYAPGVSFKPNANMTLYAIWRMNSKIYFGTNKVIGIKINQSNVKKVLFETHTIFEK